MKKIYVVGFEGNSNFGTSFWDWHPSELDAINRKEEISNAPDLIGKGTIYSGEVLISENVIDKDDINDMIELFLEENNWENSFN